MGGIMRRMRKVLKGNRGFTLIELLVVIIIIAILAAIAIPTYLGQRNKAYDASAKTLVRNSMTAMESYYVDGRDFSTATAVNLGAIEPSITFVALAAAATAATAQVTAKTVNFTVGGALTIDQYQMGSKSKSNTIYGVAVDKMAGITYYKGGAVVTSW